MDKASLVALLNMTITFRGSTGQVKTLPISSFVNVDYTTTLGSVKRKKYKRVITLTSNLLSGYTATTVNQQLAAYIKQFKQKPDAVTISQTGESEQQAETVSFLGQALLIALMLILLILVLQFNSVSKPVIILTEILFSVIGVLLGFSITGMTISSVMTGLGIVGLAGIVVKNGILVIEFADELRARGLKTHEAVVQAGKTRIIPVLLTAMAAILALIPLAVGFNINFITLFAELNPHIYLGGDNAVFWKPLSWTIIFGLAFAFFMTLVIVPSMYLIAERLRRPMRRMYGGKWVSMMGIPPLTILFIPMAIGTTIKHNYDVKRRRAKLNMVYKGETIQVEKPQKVKQAIKLMYLTIILGAVSLIVQLLLSPAFVQQFLMISVVGYLFSLAITLYLISIINERRNWARNLILIFGVWGILFILLSIQQFFSLGGAGAVITIINMILQIIILIFLFSKDANAWFIKGSVKLKSTTANEAFVGSWF